LAKPAAVNFSAANRTIFDRRHDGLLKHRDFDRINWMNGMFSLLETQFLKWFLARQHARSYPDPVKTASVEQVPEQWPDILKWVRSGEEVQMTDHDKVVAKLVPAGVSQPDFVSRAKAVWGENPPGKPLSEIVSDSRGGGG